MTIDNQRACARAVAAWSLGEPGMMRLQDALVISRCTVSPRDQAEAGARVPEPAVALAGKGDELPAAGAEADFLEDADALAELHRGQPLVSIFAFLQTPRA